MNAYIAYMHDPLLHGLACLLRNASERIREESSYKGKNKEKSKQTANQPGDPLPISPTFFVSVSISISIPICVRIQFFGKCAEKLICIVFIKLLDN